MPEADSLRSRASSSLATCLRYSSPSMERPARALQIGRGYSSDVFGLQSQSSDRARIRMLMAGNGKLQQEELPLSRHMKLTRNLLFRSPWGAFGVAGSRILLAKTRRSASTPQSLNAARSTPGLSSITAHKPPRPKSFLNSVPRYVTETEALNKHLRGMLECNFPQFIKPSTLSNRYSGLRRYGTIRFM